MKPLNSLLGKVRKTHIKVVGKETLNISINLKKKLKLPVILSGKKNGLFGNSRESQSGTNKLLDSHRQGQRAEGRNAVLEGKRKSIGVN